MALPLLLGTHGTRAALPCRDRVYSLSAAETLLRAAISSTGQFQQSGRESSVKIQLSANEFFRGVRVRRKHDACPEVLPPRKETMVSAGLQRVPLGCHQDPEPNRRGRWEANVAKDPPGGEVCLMAVILLTHLYPKEV